jgi:hypothetical protein
LSRGQIPYDSTKLRERAETKLFREPTHRREGYGLLRNIGSKIREADNFQRCRGLSSDYREIRRMTHDTGYSI